MKHLNQAVLGFVITSALATAVRGDGFVPTAGGMAYPRWNHTATRLLDGRVLVVAGRDGDNGLLTSAELYHPVTGTWTNTSSLLQGEDREFHTATLLPNGKVLVAGGLHQAAYTYLVASKLYNPTDGTWTSVGPSGFYGHTAALLANGKVLIVGGTGILGSGPYRSAILYDPASNSTSSTGSLGTARYFHTATLLASGKVLVAGGIGTNNTGLASAELYHPATGTWTNTGSLGTVRSSHTATLLPNGKVLVVGGGTNTAELYNPATGTWSPTGSPTREGDPGTLLPNGKVLVAEGTTAELYDPAAGNWSPTVSPLGNLFYGDTATLLSNGQVLFAGLGSELYESFLNPILNLVKLGDGSFKFSFNNPSGPGYRVLASTDLNTWSNLGPATETPLGSGQFQFTDHQATNYPRRFYRVTTP